VEKTRRLDKFTCPFGGQEVELLEVAYDAGGIPLLRLRIRERTRFTIFEIDAVSAARWSKAMAAWAQLQPYAGEGTPQA
jgi:hypothetical protein